MYGHLDFFSLLLLLQQHLTFFLFHARVFLFQFLFRKPTFPCFMHFLALIHFQKILKAISMKRDQLLKEEQKGVFLE